MGVKEIVYHAMKEAGWLLPENVEEVRRSEEQLKTQPVSLPDQLRDPFQFLDQKTSQTSEGE